MTDLSIFEPLQTPALLVDLDVVRANIDAMLARIGGDPTRWMPHVKTVKIPQVLDLLLAAGVRSFKCATTREADVLLARAREPIDLLVAMAHRGANLARLAELARQHTRCRLSVLTEDEAHAREVEAGGAPLALAIDVNPGFNRTGIPLADRARLAPMLRSARTIHFYEGHVRATGTAERRAICTELYERLLAAIPQLSPRGGAPWPLITSGTPTFEHALEFFDRVPGARHVVSPGTVVYWDTTSRDFGIEGFAPAVHVLTRVISRPSTARVTCDAGSKAVDAASGDPCCEVVGWPGLVAAHPSEEHLPLEVREGRGPEPGALLRLVPRHVCPTVNLADQAVLLAGGRIAEVVPVLARGHAV